MINLSPDICRQIKDARRSAGLSQSSLASQVGCKQSALSMFEQGDGTKLNDDVIEKLCARFDIKIEKGEKVEQSSINAGFNMNMGRAVNSFINRSAQLNRGFCPNVNCPSHQSYEIDGRIYLRPDRMQQDPVGGKYCAVCGELLEKKCPNCGAPIHDGAICSICGDPYVIIAQ